MLPVRYKNGIEILGQGRLGGVEFVVVARFLDFILIQTGGDSESSWAEDVYILSRREMRDFRECEYEEEALEWLRRQFPK